MRAVLFMSSRYQLEGEMPVKLHHASPNYCICYG